MFNGLWFKVNEFLIWKRMNSLFWNAYRRLEKEVIALGEAILFDDDQLKVYSERIGDLLVRTVIEIESLSKELFFANGGNLPTDRDLFFDTDCLKLLEEKWLLSKKKVMVVSPYFHFTMPENKVLLPLRKAEKRGTSGSKWKQAYQAIKHDRINNFKKGNLGNLLHALAALFLLNVYYKDAHFYLGEDYEGGKIDWGLGSDIFAVMVSKEDRNPSDKAEYVKKKDYEECVYLVKPTDGEIKRYLELLNMIKKETWQESAKVVGKILEEKQSAGDYPANNAERERLIESLFAQNNSASLKRVGERHLWEIQKVYSALRFESVLNKNQY